MNKWKCLFKTENGGVFPAKWGSRPAGIKRAAEASGYVFICIGLGKVGSKADILTEIAGALKYPSYFGMNWDALSDALTDLSWNRARGYVIMITGFRTLSEKMAAEAVMLQKIFESSAGYWNQHSVPFFVIISE